jgi:hypothetical protein
MDFASRSGLLLCTRSVDRYISWAISVLKLFSLKEEHNMNSLVANKLKLEVHFVSSLYKSETPAFELQQLSTL